MAGAAVDDVASAQLQMALGGGWSTAQLPAN